MLSDTAIRAAKPREKPYKVSDGGGLYLLINPNGSRWWRLKYRVAGKEKLLSMGIYPDVSLKTARDRRDAARKLLSDGLDPSVARQTKKEAASDTFEAVAREWLAQREEPESGRKALASVTVAKTKWMLETFIYPTLGSRPIGEIKPPELLLALRKIEKRGKHETAHRTKQKVGQVFRYAVATGRAEHDITGSLKGALAPVVSKNHAAITDPAGIGALLRAIDGYEGQPVTAAALKLAPLAFVRPGELRKAEWSEFDLDAAEWRIPAARMKMGERHIVPLSTQAIEILRELEPLTGGTGKYVFPSLRGFDRPMSENTVNAALRRLGYTGQEQTGHGFRSIASTCLNEQGFNSDLIELQLAHAERNKVRAAYNRAERLAERRKMMQAWADYLDGLKAGGKIFNLRSPGRG
ncbi:MAG TPA: integrase arm-type DNA-binding domain-containing protein [Steroidobacteraceae bacterium]|jgi:integrase